MQKLVEKHPTKYQHSVSVCVADAESIISRITLIDLIGDEIDFGKQENWDYELKLSCHEKAMLLWPIQSIH